MTEPTAKTDYDADAYLERFAIARRRLVMTRESTAQWAKNLDVEAAKVLAHLEPFFELFPCQVGADYTRVVTKFQKNSKRYGVMQLSLRIGSKSHDLMECSGKELTRLLQSVPDIGETEHHSAALKAFTNLNRRINGLTFLGVNFPEPEKGKRRLYSWLQSLSEYGPACVEPLNQAFNSFIELSDDLDQAMFDFNVAVGRMRYRTLRCTYTLDDSDPLGPSNPSIKVVTSIHPVTGKRRYNYLTDFKEQLRKKRIKRELEKQLERAATKEELKASLLKQRDRRPHEWVTKEVIKACYLGGKSGEVFKAQSQLARVMADWNQQRSQLQALLS